MVKREQEMDNLKQTQEQDRLKKVEKERLRKKELDKKVEQKKHMKHKWNLIYGWVTNYIDIDSYLWNL